MKPTGSWTSNYEKTKMQHEQYALLLTRLIYPWQTKKYNCTCSSPARTWILKAKPAKSNHYCQRIKASINTLQVPFTYDSFSTLKQAAGRINKRNAGSRQVLTALGSDTRPVIYSPRADWFWRDNSSAALPFVCTERFASCPPAQLLPGSTSFWLGVRHRCGKEQDGCKGTRREQEPLLPRHSCTAQRAVVSSSLNRDEEENARIANANTDKNGHKSERRESQLPSSTHRHTPACRYTSHRRGLQPTAWGNYCRIIWGQDSWPKFLKPPGCGMDWRGKSEIHGLIFKNWRYTQRPPHVFTVLRTIKGFTIWSHQYIRCMLGCYFQG